MKVLLVQRGLKQVDVAEEVGVDPSSFNDVLNRRRRAWPALRRRLSDHLGVPEDQLFDDIEVAQ